MFLKSTTLSLSGYRDLILCVIDNKTKNSISEMAQNFTFLFGNFVSTDYSHLEECGDPPDVRYSKVDK